VTDIYCDNSKCIYNYDGECQRTSIVLKVVPYSMMMCTSEEIRKAPVSMPADQEPNEN
jgi:hypothetical protein